MNKMKHMLKIIGMITSLCFISIVAISQEAIYFSDVKGEKASSPRLAPKITTVKKIDSLWSKEDYYTYSKNIAKISHYKDNELKINHGTFKSFHGNELLESSGYYIDNQKHGFFEHYYPNGMMRDSSHYKNGMLSGICKAWYADGSIESILEMDSTGDGTGIAIGFFPNGNVSYKGRLAKGMRKIGPWNYYHENGNKASILYYAMLDSSILELKPELKYDSVEKTSYDSLTNYYKAKCFNLEGIEIAACEIRNIKPEYASGEKGWGNYLTRNLDGFSNLISNQMNPILYVADFMVNTEGKLSFILLSNNINSSLDNAVMKIFTKASGWTSAEHNNRKIPYMHRQAIVLSPPLN